MNIPSSGTCMAKNNNTFVDSIRVKNTVFTNRISPLNGTSIIIDGLDLACQNLTAEKTELGCGASNGNGTCNTSVGVNAGNRLDTGSDNTLIGWGNGRGMIASSQNTAVGKNCMNNLQNANSNVAVGYNSGVGLRVGESNTFVGTESGFLVQTGNNNTIVGNAAGSNADTNLTKSVLIGNEAGANNTQSSRLMIDVSNTDVPLIDGRFDTRNVFLNGALRLGETGTMPVHNINTAINGTAGEQVGYIQIAINGDPHLIPYFALP